MENKYGIVGVAHVGLPTNDLQKTVEFYKSLGFEVIMQSYNEKAGEKVAFLQIKNYCIETFENGQAAMSDGAYQHVALDVEDIESMYQKICNEKYTVITDGIEELPFWENGVKFFMIKGPNEERKQQSMLSPTGWKLRRKEVFRLLLPLCSLTIKIIVSIFWIHRDIRISRKILTVR